MFARLLNEREERERERKENFARNDRRVKGRSSLTKFSCSVIYVVDQRPRYIPRERGIEHRRRARNNQIRWKIDIPPPAKIEGARREEGRVNFEARIFAVKILFERTNRVESSRVWIFDRTDARMNPKF